MCGLKEVRVAELPGRAKSWLCHLSVIGPGQAATSSCTSVSLAVEGGGEGGDSRSCWSVQGGELCLAHAQRRGSLEERADSTPTASPSCCHAHFKDENMEALVCCAGLLSSEDGA